MDHVLTCGKLVYKAIALFTDLTLQENRDTEVILLHCTLFILFYDFLDVKFLTYISFAKNGQFHYKRQLAGFLAHLGTFYRDLLQP